MHKLEMYENLRDMLEKEVGEIEKRGGLDVQSLDALYKLMTALKVTDKCIEREKGEGEMSYGYSRNSYDGMSNNYSRRYYNDSYGGMSGARRGRDGDGDGRYNESRGSYRGGSYQGGSNQGGSYQGSYGYSRDESKQEMIRKLEMMMDEPMGESERMAIMECLSKLK